MTSLTTPLAHIRARLSHSRAVWLLLALLLCAQVADSHHQVEHAWEEQEASVCDSLHSPATSLSTPANLCPPQPQVAQSQSTYLPPFVGQARNTLRAIRAPPITTQQS